MAANELVARCFAARTAAHILHLRSRSYAQHVALGEFYGAIVDTADTFAEAYQGAFGLIEAYPSLKPPEGDAIDMIVELRNWIAEYRDKCAKGRTELQNLIDELLQVCDTAIYKLRFLK